MTNTKIPDLDMMFTKMEKAVFDLEPNTEVNSLS